MVARLASHSPQRSRRLRILLGALFAAAMIVPLFMPRGALAHPLGNFTQNRYARIELYRGEVRIQYIADIAEIPSFQLRDRIDADANGAVTAEELAAFAVAAQGEYAGGIDLSLGGTRLRLSALASSAELLPGQAGLDITRIVFVYRASTAGARGELSFQDRNFDGRVGWKEIVVRPSPGTEGAVPPEFLIERTNELRTYPGDVRASPNMSSVRFDWDSSSGSAAVGAATASSPSAGRSDTGLTRFVKPLFEGRTSLGFLALALLAAIGFGALHALGPGHGKGMVAAYLVGSKGSIREALALGMTVTATHTSSVWVMALVTLSLQEYIGADRVYLYLGVAAGAMVVLMGLSLLASRLWRQLRRSHESGHRHGFWGKRHDHGPEESHRHDALEQAVGADAAGERQHAHEHSHATSRSVLTLGIAGGMLPCPSALVVMLLAISRGELLLGMVVVSAFSFGLAVVLSGIGVALVLGRRLPARSALGTRLGHPALRRLGTALPVLSAAGVTLAGMLITYQALQQPGL